MDPFIKDRMMRTVGYNKILSRRIYIQSTNIEYINDLIKILNLSGLYDIIINTNITSIEKGSIIITLNIPPAEAVIYMMIAENNDGLLIYAECDGSYYNIICDMKTDIERHGKNITCTYNILPCIINMIFGYIVCNIIKYIYCIGKIGNFKWSELSPTHMIKTSYEIGNYEPIFNTYINKFKGSIQSILPYITSKDTIIKTYEKTFPICIIQNKPTTIEHIVEWVRDKINLFNEHRHNTFMNLFNENIKALQDFYPDIKTMEPVGELYDLFIKVNNIMEYIVVAVKIRAYNYNIEIPTDEIIIDIYNKIEPTIPSMISFVEGLCEIERIKFINNASNFYTWDIDMMENKIIRNDIIYAKEIEINGVNYNEWHTFTYSNMDATLEDMIIDLNIMYGTFIEMILYDNIIIYNDMNNDNMDINIKTLFMDRFNIDIAKENITLQLIGMGEILLPLKIEKRQST